MRAHRKRKEKEEKNRRNISTPDIKKKSVSSKVTHLFRKQFIF